MVTQSDNANDWMTAEQVLRTLLQASDKRVLVTVEYRCQTHDCECCVPGMQRTLAITGFKQVGKLKRWGLYCSEVVRGRLISFSPIKLFLLDGIRRVSLTEQRYDRDSIVSKKRVAA